mgnify:CR=1 FL=1
MNQFIAVTKALSDETRVRALMSLRGGELCLCQIIELLHLAPSTISKHMDLLRQAGLVRRRKAGRWQYFSLADKQAPAEAQKALAWTVAALADNPILKADAKKLGAIRKKQLTEVSSCCYREN